MPSSYLCKHFLADCIRGSIIFGPSLFCNLAPFPPSKRGLGWVEWAESKFHVTPRVRLFSTFDASSGGHNEIATNQLRRGGGMHQSRENPTLLPDFMRFQNSTGRILEDITEDLTTL